MYSSSALTDIPSANVGGFFLTRCCAVGIPRILSVLRTPDGVARVFYGVAMSAIRGLFSHRNDLRSQIPDTGAESASHNGGEGEEGATALHSLA